MDKTITIGNHEIKVSSNKSGIFLESVESYRAIYLTVSGARQVAAALLESANEVEQKNKTS
jgi:hypothetical protein